MAKYKIEVIQNVSELETIFSSLVPNSVRSARSEELVPAEVRILNKHFVENSYACWVPATKENLVALCSLRLCKEGEHPLFTVGGAGYRMDRNTKNRPLSLSRVSPVTKSTPTPTYSNLMSRGLWASGAGILLFRDDKEISSAQHTATAGIVAIDSGSDLSGLFFLCVFGLPPQFTDWVDKGRARNKIQDSFGDSSLFSPELVSQFQLETTPAGKDSEKERIAFLKLHSKISESVLLRFRGSDISPTGGKLGWEQESAFMDRFQDGRETLQKLTVKVWEAGKTQDGKQGRTFLSLFNPAVIGTGLILASNDADTIQNEISELITRNDGESPEDFTERRLETLSSLLCDTAPIRIDWDFVDKVLELLSSSTDNSGSLSPVFADLFEKITKDKKDADSKKHLYVPLSIASLSAFVELLKNIRSGDYNSSVWTSYRKVAAPGKDEKKISPAYRAMGGMDIGYVNTRKSKDE